MKRQCLVLCLLMGCLVAACGHNRDKELSAIRQSEQELAAANVEVSGPEVRKMVNLYTDFASHFPTDSLAPVYLQRAADMCICSMQFDRAVQIIDSVIAQYPGYEDIGGCWFLRGYAFENAEQFDSARAAYTYFVDHYPDHPLAADTRATLPYLGLSYEEMLEIILAQAEKE